MVEGYPVSISGLRLRRQNVEWMKAHAKKTMGVDLDHDPPHVLVHARLPNGRMFTKAYASMDGLECLWESIFAQDDTPLTFTIEYNDHPLNIYKEWYHDQINAEYAARGDIQDLLPPWNWPPRFCQFTPAKEFHVVVKDLLLM